MKHYFRGQGGWILALAIVLFVLISADCLAESPTPSRQSISAGLESDANTFDESDKNRQSPATHAQIESKKSALNLEGRPKPLVKTLRGALVGTGWPTVSGYVVTSNHVVSDCNDVVVISRLGEELPARAVLRDEVSDIALLEVSEPRKLPPALPLAKTKAKLGTAVFTIGFPRVHYMGKTPKLFTGVISSVNGLRDDPSSYHTTVPIQPGNSGGPLLNMNGEVVGVVTSMLGIRDIEDGHIRIMQNASCVLKIASVKKLLPQLPKKDFVIDVLPRHSDSLEVLAERIEGSVLMVIAR
ncbi:MAG: serine protease [Syntrophobacterales bacterium]|jgi:S1-C subfamily serine protease